jgi:hypothetical protein
VELGLEKGELLFDRVASALADAKQEFIAFSLTAVNSDCGIHENRHLTVSKAVHCPSRTFLCRLRLLTPV